MREGEARVERDRFAELATAASKPRDTMCTYPAATCVHGSSASRLDGALRRWLARSPGRRAHLGPPELHAGGVDPGHQAVGARVVGIDRDGPLKASSASAVAISSSQSPTSKHRASPSSRETQA